MATDTQETIVTPEELADNQAVFDAFSTGKLLDPEIGRRVLERGKRMREELRQKFGVLDIGVPAIRELRGELPNP